LLRAPLRNWFGWCFTTRLLRGLGVGVGSTVAVGVDCVVCGLDSCLDVVDTGRILGVEVALVATVVVGVGCVSSGVGSCLGVGDTGRILGVEVALVATFVGDVDCVGGALRIVLSKPYIEIQITIREAPLISLCFSIRSRLHRMPSVEATVRRSLNLSVGATAVRTNLAD
jgi:hypothetical protein